MTNPDASRKEFEAWFKDTHDAPHYVRDMERILKWDSKHNLYFETWIQAYFNIWQAARSDKGEAVGTVVSYGKDGDECTATIYLGDLSIKELSEKITIGNKVYLAAPQQAIPAGYALVPIEPTSEMVSEAWRACPLKIIKFADAWKAMLSAAPTAPIDGVK
jgi:hypothetical protein